jgi:hypothetical protein
MIKEKLNQFALKFPPWLNRVVSYFLIGSWLFIIYVLPFVLGLTVALHSPLPVAESTDILELNGFEVWLYSLLLGILIISWTLIVLNSNKLFSLVEATKKIRDRKLIYTKYLFLFLLLGFSLLFVPFLWIYPVYPILPVEFFIAVKGFIVATIFYAGLHLIELIAFIFICLFDIERSSENQQKG